jgi:hypothetical protein
MRMAAGKDGTALFDKHHAWVNIDFIMDKCIVGPLAGESPGALQEEDEEGDELDEFERQAMENAKANARHPGGAMDEMD